MRISYLLIIIYIDIDIVMNLFRIQFLFTTGVHLFPG